MNGLSEQQRQLLMNLIAARTELPHDFKHVLFPPDRKEYELVYASKEREEDILAGTMALPLQPVKTFGASTNDNWSNRLIFGDNLQAMQSLLHDPQVKGRVKLVYIDPPFSTKREFRGSQEQKAYQDKVEGAQFLEFLRKRLVLIKELLAPDGVLVLHMDIRKGHYVKVLLDEIFGENCFRNEVIWKRTGARSKSKTFNHIHDNLFVYSKGDAWTWNVQYTDYTEEYVENFFKPDEGGRLFRETILTAPGTRRGPSGNPWRGVDPTAKGRHWAIPGYIREQLSEYAANNVEQALDELDEIGRVAWPDKDGGVPSFKQYLDEMQGVELQSIWTDIKPVSANAKEGTKYPTQKPEQLLFRFISTLTNPGDLVLDSFAGSGTSCAVAEKLGRRWIAIDCGKLSIYTIQKRLLNLRSEIGNNKGQVLPPRAFTLFNAGLYDLSAVRSLPWKDYRFFALRLFQCQDESHSVNGVNLDGYRGTDDVLVFDHQNGSVMLDYGFVDQLHDLLGSKVGSQFFVISPASSVAFLEDYLDRGGTRYYILRIPYSIIRELHERDFAAIKQPLTESDVNATVEAVGFDFIRPPEVRCEFDVEAAARGGRQIVMRIRDFRTEAMVRGASRMQNLEALSMVLVDLDYNGEIFDVDRVLFSDDLKKDNWEIRFSSNGLGNQMMLIYVDVFGNELREIKSYAEFD